MGLRFTKMHSLGNDFMVLDGVNQAVTLTPDVLKQLSNRHTGIGFDQCLLVELSPKKDIDFEYRIFNADGSEVGQCGNGARCLGAFLKHYGLTKKNKLRIATRTTVFELCIDSQFVRVAFAPAKFEPEAIPMLGFVQQDEYELPVSPTKSIRFHALNVGNPHLVIRVPDVQAADLLGLGAQLSKHAAFPEETNVGFMECVSAGHIKLRVYERGVGETLACGSGALAAATVARKFYQADEEIEVQLPGGRLHVQCADPLGVCELGGPVSFVYEGEVF